MAAITVADLKAHLNITLDDDDDLLASKIAVAEAWVVAQTGGSYAGDVPPPVLEAIRRIAADLYENREASADTRLTEAPFGVTELLAPYRDWAF